MGRLSGGWFASGYDGYARGNRCLVSASPRNGYVVQAAPARDYASFEAFEDAVRRLPVRSSLEPRPDVVFTTLDGAVLHARMGEAATVGGRPVDHAHWPLFDSPYGHSERGSGRLEMTHGEERYVLDFNTPRVESPRR